MKWRAPRSFGYDHRVNAHPAPTPTATPRAPSKLLNIASWVAQVLAAVAFLGAGSSKLRGVPQMVEAFGALGLGQWFRYFTGGLEVVCAILLLVPGLAGVGALLLAATMLCAVIAHLTVLPGTPLPALVLLVLVAFVAWSRRERTLGLFGRRGR